MIEDWQPKDTSTHQDHVIAHVVGATALGYMLWDEAVYILLDIGFMWMIYRDGEMGLMPHPVAVAEIETTEPNRNQIKADVDALLATGEAAKDLQLFCQVAGCEINEVSFFQRGEERRLLISGEESNLALETSLTNDEIRISSGPRASRPQ